MDPSERLTESLLGTAWAGQAMELFGDELQDLELLEEEEKAFQADMQRMREMPLEGTQAFSESPDKTAGGHEKKDASKSKKISSLQSKRGNAGRPALTAGAGKNARDMKERESTMTAMRGQEFWYRTIQNIKQQIQHTREEADTRRAYSRRQQRFFSARGIDEYTMDEILSGAPVKSSRSKLMLTTDTAADAATAKEAPCNDGPITVHSTEPMTDDGRLSLTRSTGTEIMDTGCDFTIDAIAFAKDLNASLGREYGFHPVLSAPEDRGEAAHTASSITDLKKKLLTHAPGDILSLGELCGSILPPVSSRSEGYGEPPPPPPLFPPPPSGNTDESNTKVSLPFIIEQDDRKTTSMYTDTNAKASATTVAPSATTTAVAATATSPVEIATTTTAPTTPTKTKTKTKTKMASKGEVKPSKVSATRKKGPTEFSHIECSAENNRVRLQSTVGVEVSTTVRFINRDPNLLRMRIPPSKHSWITYSMIKSSVDKVTVRSTTHHSSSPSSTPPVSPRTTLNEPLGCGGFVDVRITFEPQSATEPLIREVLQLGHCRELNSRRGEGAKWHFFDVEVQCETVLPQFSLIPVINEGETDTVSSGRVSSITGGKKSQSLEKLEETTVTTCEFPCTYLMDTCSRKFYLVNNGSFAVVTLSSTSPCFKIDPSPETTFLLPGGDRVIIVVSFAPMKEMRYEAEELLVTVREMEDEPVILEQRFGLCGEGVLPHVEIVRIGSLELTSPREGATVPKYMVPCTAPGVETEVLVILRNNGPIPVPYFWKTESIGGGNDGRSSRDGESCYATGADLSVTPSTGVFPPHEESTFFVYMKPSAAQPLAAVLNLFLEGLPEPSVGHAITLDPYLRGGRPIPALPGLDELQAMSDPYTVFQPCTRSQPDDCLGVFATGFYLFADPVMPSLVIIPDHLEEGVDCLIHYSNVRRITMRNNSPRLLHFCFDPTPSECTPDVVLSSGDREGVDVKFEPRKGSVQPYSSVIVLFRFIVKEVGHHFVCIDCYIPEVMGLLATTPSIVTGIEEDWQQQQQQQSPSSETILAPPTAELRCSHQIQLSVTGVGPTVHVSADCLDFGLIEQGSEAEASFTVSNVNPITVVFDLRDPMMREPPRFVFLPDSFRLAAGESVEVTVYRQAVELGDSQTFFELVVRGGDTIAIETRATIQSPFLILEEAVMDFGVVPNGAWVERSFVLSNASAFDIPYVLEPTVLPPCIQVAMPPPGVVRAGCKGIRIPIRCVFQVHSPGSGGNEALLSIKNTRTGQELLLELHCERVQELTVTLDLIHIPKASEGPGGMAYTPPLLPRSLPPPPKMKISSFIEALLWNLVELNVFNGNISPNQDGSARDVTILREGETHPVSLRSYCPPVILKAYLPDKEPVWSELLALQVSNLTGCNGSYMVEALNYAFKSTAADEENICTDADRGGLPSSMMAKIMTTTKKTATYFNRRISLKPSSLAKNGTKNKQQQLGNFSLMSRRNKSNMGTSSMGPIQRAFWCTGVNGIEQMERERRATLVDAQRILLDGRGIATIFGNSPAGLLHPQDRVEVPISILSNLPGRYEETLQVQCDEMPYTHLPLTLELSGKPVLLDSSTAGLTVLGGRELMLMPSVIAGIGRSWRSMLLINRVPRDLHVSVKIFLTAATFSVVAVDEEVNANAVTLQLQSVSEEENRRESEGKGKVAASPENLFLPALSSREVIIEYCPDATFVSKESGGGLEREWRGGVIITAEVADTPFNDGFLIDAFYRLHAAKYPAERVMRERKLQESEPAWARSIVRPIVTLKLQQPSISRPGVIRNNTVLPPTPGELLVLKKHFASSKEHSRTGGGGGGGITSEELRSDLDNQAHSCIGRSIQKEGDRDNEKEEDRERDEEEEEEKQEKSLTDDIYAYHDGSLISRKPLEAILADEEERKALYTFMVERKMELAEHGRRYFIPIELELRARCVAAQLSVEPSSDVIYFPPYVDGKPCKRSLQLTNSSCAAMEFILHLPSPSFRIVSSRFISKNADVEPLESEDEEMKGRRTMEDLKWCSREEQQRAQRLLASAKQQKSVDMAITEIRIPNFKSNTEENATRAETDPLTFTKYLLRPQDALEVNLEYCKPSKEEVDAMMRENATVKAALNVMYLPSDGAVKDPAATTTRTKTHGGNESSPNLFPSPVLELTQTIPISLTFSTPSVLCRPSKLWFRPGQLLHDGRPQPSYPQKIQLVSFYTCAVSFAIIPSHRACTESFEIPSTTTATTTTAAATTTTTQGDGGSVETSPRQYRTYMARQAARVLTRERQIKGVVQYWKGDDDGTSPTGAANDEDEVDTESTTIDVYSPEYEKPGQMPLDQQQLRRRRRKQQQQWVEEKPLVVGDTERFTITPMQGIIPGATRGGQPGVCEISVTFKECMDARFESVFDVVINGRPDTRCYFSLRGDSRVTEI